MGNAAFQVEITPDILLRVSDVARQIGRFEGHRCGLKPSVKRENYLRNLHGSLALEGSTLTVEEVNALMKGQTVGAMEREWHMGKAFHHAYEKSSQFEVSNVKDILTAFLLMNDGHLLHLQRDGSGAEQWNSRMKESIELMGALFGQLQPSNVLHPLVSAAAFHYQMFHLRPFYRCNSAVARLWNRLLWAQYHSVFFHAPFEMVLKQKQQQYVDALGETASTQGQQYFVAFLLELAHDGISMILEGLDTRAQRAEDRLAFARMHFGSQRVTRKQYMALFGNIGPATASRDLKMGFDAGLLDRQGSVARTEYRFL